MSRSDLPYRAESDGHGGYNIYDPNSPFAYPAGGSIRYYYTECPYNDLEQIRSYRKEIKRKMDYINIQYAKSAIIIILLGIIIMFLSVFLAEILDGLLSLAAIITGIVFLVKGIKIKNTCKSLNDKVNSSGSDQWTDLQKEYWELRKKYRGCNRAENTILKEKRMQKERNSKVLNNEQNILNKVRKM